MKRTSGRLITAVFSSNMNRIQMIVDAARNNGRKVALDGRSMLATAELAVRLGALKVPQGTLVAMRQLASLPDNQIVIVCTGGQGEPGAALSRMAAGSHANVTLKAGDSVVISSTPIPGNEVSYQQIGDQLARRNVTQYRHPTHEIDGCGPLHVSGHGGRDESADMIRLTRPRYLMPIYRGPLPRYYHRQIGLAEGLPDSHIIMADNGTVIEFAGPTAMPVIAGRAANGSLLIDQTGAVVPNVVSRDRLSAQDAGFLVVIVTLDATGQPLTSPDIISRGQFAVKDRPELIDELRRRVKQLIRRPARSQTALNHLKIDLQAVIQNYLFEATGLTPLVIPVITRLNHHGVSNVRPKPVADVHS